MKKSDRIRIAYFVLAAFLVALFLLFSYARIFDEFEYSTIDFRYAVRPPRVANQDIVIIEVGDDSIEKLGKWPFPRNYHALLVQALRSVGADTVIFDIFFSEKKEGDAAFAESVKESGNVYIPYVFDLARDARERSRIYATGYAAPLIEPLKEAARGTGYVNVEPDADGKIRRIPPFIEYNGVYYPHITFLVALNKLGYDFDKINIVPGKYIKVSEDLTIPLGDDSSVLVDYPAKWGKAFRHYSYVDILQSYLADVTGQTPAIDLGELKDTVCFIGLTATASPDAHPSPTEPLYPGVGVHTSLYNSVMNRSFLDRMSRWGNIAILVFLWLLTGYVTAKSRKRFAVISIVLIMTGYVAAAVLAFWLAGVWIDVFYPLVTIAAIYVIFTFKKYVAETQKRELLEKELDIAKTIQESFLPTDLPVVGGVEADASMVTARQVGGDLYDAVQLDDDRVGFMMGDVSGKGVPAALYMARVVSVFRTFVNTGTPCEVMGKMNDRLVARSGSGLFVTLTYMILDTASGMAHYSIGGHMPTLLIEPDGNVEFLDVEEGMPLGMIECGFSPGEKKYKPGSIFVLYTDGVTEAMDARGEMFGQDCLAEIAATLKGASPAEVVDAILRAVSDFEGKEKQHDDITVMAIRA